MLRSLTGLESYAIVAIDGPIGRVQEFLFADEAWIIRYLVVNTGRWVSSRKVLISPIAINQRNRDSTKCGIWTTMNMPTIGRVTASKLCSDDCFRKDASIRVLRARAPFDLQTGHGHEVTRWFVRPIRQSIAHARRAPDADSG